MQGRRVRLLTAAVLRVRRHVLLMAVNPYVGIDDGGVEGIVVRHLLCISPDSETWVVNLVEVQSKC